MHLSTAVATVLLLSTASASPVIPDMKFSLSELCGHTVVGGPPVAPVPGSCTLYCYCGSEGYGQIHECLPGTVYIPKSGVCIPLPKGEKCVDGKHTNYSGYLDKQPLSNPFGDITPASALNAAALEPRAYQDDVEASVDKSQRLCGPRNHPICY